MDGMRPAREYRGEYSMNVFARRSVEIIRKSILLSILIKLMLLTLFKAPNFKCYLKHVFD